MSMNALVVLFAGNLSDEVFQPLIGEKSSLFLGLARSRAFPGVTKTVILTKSEGILPGLDEFSAVEIEKRDSWTVKTMLEAISIHAVGYDLVYFTWADYPFLDPQLADKLAQRHLRYAAEYSYADGWPLGLAPELLSPGTAAILVKILGDDDGGVVSRDALFSVIKKDINAFDIETEISSVDLRSLRINLCADSKRNFLLLQRFTEELTEKVTVTFSEIERIIAEKPEILRTLPAFYPIQVCAGCPQICSYCPWAIKHGQELLSGRDHMDVQHFESLLNKIIAFSNDAVIDLSLWGELSLHPHKIELIEAVLTRPELALIIETSGIGWKNDELEYCAELAHKAENTGQKNILPPLSWIVSLDSSDPLRYKEVRGAGFAEANDSAKKLLSLFPKDAYVQAVRTKGAEDDIERFYRSWKETAPNALSALNTNNVIIQKYDDFCGMLPHKQASDLSPIQRQPCWHLMRDMPILLDGTVLLCREQIAADDNKRITLGNAFNEPLDAIWEQGQRLYAEQALSKQYNLLCAECDEYYTYNF